MNKKIYVILVVVILAFSLFCACAPEPAKPLTLSEENVTLIVGESITITADGGQGEVVWTSSDEKIAVVEGGTITAIEYGSAEIVATAGNESAKCVVTVVFASSDYPVKVSLNTNKVTLNTYYNNTKTYNLIASVIDNGEPVDKTIEWKSSNTQVATVENGLVTAKQNGTAYITATVREGKKFASALCVVTVKDDVEIAISGASDTMKAGEVLNLTATVTVNGNTKDNAEITWASSDDAVATVSQSGAVTAHSSGWVEISATAFGQSQSVGILVGDIILISNGEDLLNIDKGNETTVYKLVNNIDMSAYFAQNEWSQGSVIKNLSATLDGQGYAITGIKRTAKFGESAGEGFFGNINASAVIKNVYVELDYVVMSEGASVLASVLVGRIDNSYVKANVFDYSEGESEKTSMIGTNNGSTDIDNASVYRTIFDINAVDSASQKVAITPFSIKGTGSYDNVVIISQKYATKPAYKDGFGNNANTNVRICFAYPEASDFVAGENGMKAMSTGISTKAIGNKSVAWAESEAWLIDSNANTVALKNATGTPVVYAPSIETVIYGGSYKKGEAIEIISPDYENQSGNQNGLSLTYDIFDSLGRSVKSQVENNKFIPSSIGKYTVIYTVADSATGFINVSDAQIIVGDNVIVDTGIRFELVLPISGTKTVSPQITGYSGGSWSFSSNNQAVATVSNSGTITARSTGYAVITVKHNETNKEQKVVVRTYENMIAIDSEEDFIEMGENENPNNYYYLTKDLDFSSTSYLKVNSYVTFAGVTSSRYYTVSKVLHGTLDGNGHIITFNLDLTAYNASENLSVGGLFVEIAKDAVVKNMILYSDIKSIEGKTSNFLAAVHHGEIIDSYFNLVVETTEDSRAEGSTLVGTTAVYQDNAFGDFTRCIMYIDATANGAISGSGGYAGHFAWSSWATYDTNSIMTDCMLIGKNNKYMMYSIGRKTRCYGYKDFDSFFDGTGYHSVNEAYAWNGYMDLDSPNTDTPAYTHAGFAMSQWDIKKGSIKLCGREVDIANDSIYSTSDGLTVKWNNVEGATGYNVYKGNTLIETVESPMYKALTEERMDEFGTSAEYVIKVVPVFGTEEGKHYTTGVVKYSVKGRISTISELKQLKNETDSGAIYVLLNDIEITQNDMEWFFVDTSSGDGSQANNSVLSVIESLSCVLNGNGHKITISLNENMLSGDRTFASQTGSSKAVGGLVANMKPGSKIMNVYFDVTTNISSNVRVGACAYLSYGTFESCYVDFKYNRPDSIDYSDRKITMCAFTITWDGRTKNENHGHFDSCILKIVARNTSNNSVIKTGGFGGIYDGGAWTATDQFTRLNKFDNCIFISETGKNTVFSNVSGARNNCYVFESIDALRNGSGYKLLTAFSGYTYIGQAGASDNNSQTCDGPSAQVVTAQQYILDDTANWNNGIWTITSTTVKFYDKTIG